MKVCANYRLPPVGSSTAADLRLVATGTGANQYAMSVLAWTVADGKPVWNVEHDSTADYPRRCAFSPNGDFIVASNLILSSEDGAVRQRVPRAVTGRADWSSDNQRLACPTDSSVDVIDATSGARVTQIQGHIDRVLATAWSPDQRLLAVGSRDNTISIWDWQNNELVVTLRGHLDGADDLCWKPDGTRLASVSMREGVVHLWTVPATPIPRSLNVGAFGSSLRWNRDGTRLACLSGQGLKIFDADSGRPTFASAWPAVYAAGDRALAWSPHGNRLAACQANTVVVLDADNEGQELCRLPPQKKPLNAVAWNRSGDRLLATSNPGGAAGGTLVEANADTGAITSNEPRDIAPYHFGHAVVFSPDGERFVTTGWAGVRVWDARTRQVLGQYSDNSLNWVSSVEWNPNGTSLAFACGDRSIRIVDSTQYKLQHSLLGHTAEVKAISWSSDGRRIASAGSDHTLVIWDAALARQVLTLRGHNSDVVCVSWSPDGKRLASLDREGKLNVWDATPAFAREAR